jgi:hypothetical protein
MGPVQKSQTTSMFVVTESELLPTHGPILTFGHRAFVTRMGSLFQSLHSSFLLIGVNEVLCLVLPNQHLNICSDMLQLVDPYCENLG